MGDWVVGVAPARGGSRRMQRACVPEACRGGVQVSESARAMAPAVSMDREPPDSHGIPQARRWSTQRPNRHRIGFRLALLFACRFKIGFEWKNTSSAARPRNGEWRIYKCSISILKNPYLQFSHAWPGWGGRARTVILGGATAPRGPLGRFPVPLAAFTLSASWVLFSQSKTRRSLPTYT